MFERSTSDARPIDGDESHRCASDRDCVNADTREFDPETGRPIRKGALIADGPLCRGCMMRLESAVNHMPADYDRLSDAIGDSVVGGGDKVHLTRDAAIPLNTSTEALMSRILDVTTRAAEMVAAEMNMDSRIWPPNPYMAVSRASKLLAPTLQVLVSIEPQAAMVWGRVPSGDEGWDDKHGQPRELVEQSGLDLAHELLEINRLVGVQLGKSKLRHHFSMPCPAYDYKKRRYCGAMTVGRDDGTDFVNCSTCGTSWTEVEYGFLTGLVTSEIKQRKENDMLRFLLAEAYWRLDTLRRLAEALQDLDVEAVVNDGPEKAAELVTLITSQVSTVLTMGAAPHPRPEDRRASSVKPKKQRQKAIDAPRKAIEA